ncbi:MAG: maleylpyruvate isomerase N-terminal domain-containing protein [Saprospiraceae bacterium]
MSDKHILTETIHLFPDLDDLLIPLLRSLSKNEWNARTIAKLWTVKDVAAHLLDGNLKGLSNSRDHYFGPNTSNIDSYSDLVSFINRLNHTWTDAAQRLSPVLLIDLLEITGKLYSDHLFTLNPDDKAIFSVAWAGEVTSSNRFHINREYTEKFLHQQQIRDAVFKPGLLTKELFFPFMDTLAEGLPYTYRNVEAPTGTILTLTVISEIGGSWSIIKREKNWELIKTKEVRPDAKVEIDPETAWKLFSKGMMAQDAMEKIKIYGDLELGLNVLKMISVMA